MKQIWLVATGSLLLLLILFFFGRTKPIPKEDATIKSDNAIIINTSALLDSAKKVLTPNQLAKINSLENALIAAADTPQKIDANKQLASFWHDSLQATLPYLWYQGEKAKLENTEKNLNFAAQSYIEELKSQDNPQQRSWMADQAKALFDKVLELNPNNDSAKVGWGSTFIFGASGASSPMEGIMKIREVAERDSTNMYAQFMLGYGAMMTGQFDRAIDRLKKVSTAEPENTEAIFLLAEAYERAGNKTDAVKWYRIGKSKVTNPQLQQAIDEKMKILQ
ncbi:MAG: tetratricopeptide repeat protein [Sphingobacteriales bacterium]